MENKYERKIILEIDSTNVVKAIICGMTGKITKYMTFQKLRDMILASEGEYREKPSVEIYKGYIPKNTVYVKAYDDGRISYFILKESCIFPINFLDQEYKVPIPNLIFKFDCKNGHVINGGVVAVDTNKVKMDTKIYAYPFTNASIAHLCWGYNKIPSVEEDIGILSNLPDYFIALPSNLHGYSNANNSLNLECRPLLEFLQGQDQFPLDLLSPLKMSLVHWVDK